jgi:hypothetical protein
MHTASNYKGGKTPLALAGLAIILMISTPPLVNAFTGVTSYASEFYRTSCTPLGNFIQARFNWDIQNSDNLIIKEVGVGGASKNDVPGAFKFEEFPVNQNYTTLGYGTQYPGIEAWANFRHYEMYSVNISISEPTNTNSDAVVTHQLSIGLDSGPYPVNFSSAADEYQILISQSSTYIWANYSIVSSSGTTIHEWSIAQPYSGVIEPPPYKSTTVSDALLGLDPTEGYASVLPGTDFQIESVIHPYQATDYTGYNDFSFSKWYDNGFKVSCPAPYHPVQTYFDEEGTNAVYSELKNGTYQPSNEAFQYFEVGGQLSSVTVRTVDQNNNTITGYYTVLYDGNGHSLHTGFTPVTFSSLVMGGSYAVQPENYNNCNFNHWLSGGSTNSYRSFNASGYTFTAVYSGSGCA